MNKEKTIDELNTLVEINNDRIKGYETASEHTREEELHELFSELKRTSQQCRHQLISEISHLDGEAAEGTNTSGKFFRSWMDIKSALAGEDRKAILDSCQEGEEQADKTYQSVLDDSSGHLNSDQIAMIKAQHELLKADQNKIRRLHEAMTAVS
ncbi:MAG: PA2169 family four-helix-bundle protein [Balneolaceae bacterium]